MGSEAFASLLYLLGIYGEICYNITIMCQNALSFEQRCLSEGEDKHNAKTRSSYL